MSIYHLSVITHKCKIAQQELLASIVDSSVIAHKHCIPHVAQANLQVIFKISQGTKHYTHFRKFGHGLYRMYATYSSTPYLTGICVVCHVQ